MPDETIQWGGKAQSEQQVVSDIVQKTQQLGRPPVWTPFSLISGEDAKMCGKTLMHSLRSMPKHLRKDEPAWLVIHITSDEPGDKTHFSLKYEDGVEIAVSVSDLWYGTIDLPLARITKKLHVAKVGERSLDGKVTTKRRK